MEDETELYNKRRVLGWGGDSLKKIKAKPYTNPGTQ